MRSFATDGGAGAGTDRSDIVLAALSAGGRSARFDPVQVQNLLFLIDSEVADDFRGSHIDFEPYHAGPYDPTVCDVAESLAVEARAVIDRAGPCWTVSVSDAGFGQGRAALHRMARRAGHYVAKASRWMLAQPSPPIVPPIYRGYPEMAVSSRIRRAALCYPEAAGCRRMPPALKGMASWAGVFHSRRHSDETKPWPNS